MSSTTSSGSAAMQGAPAATNPLPSCCAFLQNPNAGAPLLTGMLLLILAIHLLSLWICAKILEAREQLSQNFQYQTKLEGNEDTVVLTLSNADGTAPTPVNVVPSLKDQDASSKATSFGKDYGIFQTIHLDVPSKDTISNTGAVSSDSISSSVPVQLVPVLRGATELSGMEENMHTVSKEDATEFSQSMFKENRPDFTAKDAEANEETVTLVDSAASKEDEQKQPSSDLSEQSRAVIQKADNDEVDDDGDEWLKEDMGCSGSTHIQIAEDDEDVSFSDLEEDDDAA